jgi:hypothetical protein
VPHERPAAPTGGSGAPGRSAVPGNAEAPHRDPRLHQATDGVTARQYGLDERPL